MIGALGVVSSGTGRMQRVDLDSTTSTNDEARRRLVSCPREPVLVTARVQTAGRGRLGRRWISPEGGVWMTAGWPTGRPMTGAVMLAVAGAAADAIESVLAREAPGFDPGELRIRWPNDLLLQERKVGGLLGEAIATPGGRALLLGLGVNVNNPAEALGSAELRTPAWSLAGRAGRALDFDAIRSALGDAVLGALQRFETDGLCEGARERIAARLAWVGRPVRLAGSGETHKGVLAGIDRDGALVLEQDGVRRAFVSGELSCRPSGVVPGAEEDDSR